MIKWPEPINRDDTEHGVLYVTEAQLKQAVRDALEDAAKVAETAAHRLGGHQFAASGIRALIKEIE